MDKHALAQELRQRQYNTGLVPCEMIDALSDDAIIDSYITCSDCQMRQVDSQHLAIAIDQAHDAQQFFQLCNEFADTHYKKTHVEPQKKVPPKRRNFQRNKDLPFKKRDW